VGFTRAGAGSDGGSGETVIRIPLKFVKFISMKSEERNKPDRSLPTAQSGLIMNRNSTLLIVALAIIALSLIGALIFLNTSHPVPASAVPITISTPPTDASALYYIAEDRQFFSENGLNVTARYYNPAAAGIPAMLHGEVDVAGVSEYAVVLNALDGKNISILASTVGIQNVYLIGLKDRGIGNITDLRGKKIGVSRGSNAEFYLGRFLTLHGIDIQDVTLVDVLPPQYGDALAAGGIDAIICPQPYVSQITGSMGDAVISWPAQSGQLVYGVAVARRDWAAHNPDLAQRYLRSIGMAADYIATNPAESQAIVQKRLNLSDAYMTSVWPENHFSLTLDQSLVLAMEDEARWMIKNNMTNATVVPDFRNYIYPDTLDAVKPGSVNIIR
jgi:ABC-type nitrate/sulfonate/bicarbonate transport system substrate-binding protein